MQSKKDRTNVLVSYHSLDHSSEQGVHRELGGTDASQSVEKGAQESPGRSSKVHRQWKIGVRVRGVKVR